MNEQNNNFDLEQGNNEMEYKNVEISNINVDNNDGSDSENKMMNVSQESESNINLNDENNEVEQLNNSSPKNITSEEQIQQHSSNNEIQQYNDINNQNNQEVISNPSIKNENTNPSIITNEIDNKENQIQQNVNTQPIYNMNTINTNNVNNGTKSFYENFDIQQMKYSLIKNFTQLKINKDEDFMERMKFDIYKRQVKEDKINKLLEQNKNRLNEEDRIKAFNRLIEDANRRIEAQDNLNTMRNRLDNNLIGPPPKKYTPNEWKSIYNGRFLNFLYETNKKREEKIKEKRQQEQMEEEEEVALCKNKKANRKVCEESGKRMYEEAIKRKVRMEEKIKKNNDEAENKKRNGKKLTIGNRNKINIPNISNTEINNKRFEGNVNIDINAKNEMMNIHKQKEYLEKYLREEDEIKDQRNMPVPMSNPMKGNFTYNNMHNIERKKLEHAAINRLHPKSTNINVDYIKKSSINACRGHNRFYKESEASRIVDQFFTQNLKQIH